MAMTGGLRNLFCSRGERMYFLRDSLSQSIFSLGATLKGKHLRSKFFPIGEPPYLK